MRRSHRHRRRASPWPLLCLSPSATVHASPLHTQSDNERAHLSPNDPGKPNSRTTAAEQLKFMQEARDQAGSMASAPYHFARGVIHAFSGLTGYSASDVLPLGIPSSSEICPEAADAWGREVSVAQAPHPCFDGFDGAAMAHASQDELDAFWSTEGCSRWLDCAREIVAGVRQQMQDPEGGIEQWEHDAMKVAPDDPAGALLHTIGRKLGLQAASPGEPQGAGANAAPPTPLLLKVLTAVSYFEMTERCAFAPLPALRAEQRAYLRSLPDVRDVGLDQIVDADADHALARLVQVATMECRHRAHGLTMLLMAPRAAVGGGLLRAPDAARTEGFQGLLPCVTLISSSHAWNAVKVGGHWFELDVQNELPAGHLLLAPSRRSRRYHLSLSPLARPAHFGEWLTRRRGLEGGFRMCRVGDGGDDGDFEWESEAHRIREHAPSPGHDHGSLSSTGFFDVPRRAAVARLTDEGAARVAEWASKRPDRCLASFAAAFARYEQGGQGRAQAAREAELRADATSGAGVLASSEPAVRAAWWPYGAASCDELTEPCERASVAAVRAALEAIRAGNPPSRPYDSRYSAADVATLFLAGQCGEEALTFNVVAGASSGRGFNAGVANDEELEFRRARRRASGAGGDRYAELSARVKALEQLIDWAFDVRESPPRMAMPDAAQYAERVRGLAAHPDEDAPTEIRELRYLPEAMGAVVTVSTLLNEFYACSGR